MQALSRLTLVLLLPLALILAACSGGGASASAAAPTEAPPASEAPASEAPASMAPASEAPSAAAGGTVVLSESALGQILTDAEGNVLYGFTPDTEGVSTCYDECAANWPPLLAEGEVTAGAGLDAMLLTTVERTDGTMQVKYGDWPLYYFANDAAAGDTNGQGINDVWFVVGADGALIQQ